MRRLKALVWIGALSGVLVAGCLARRDEPFQRVTDDDAGPPDPVTIEGSPPDAPPDDLEVAPHVVLSVDPAHGPFIGETRVIVRGNGFASDARVWFGDVEVPQDDVDPIDPQRLQVKQTPPGTGTVAVRVQNGDAESTSATLKNGYTYDPFFATPSTGPTSGGTTITLKGNGTRWDQDTEVEIDRLPCENLEVLSPTELTCVTPAGSAGAKVLSVIQGGEEGDVLDGFSYANNKDGFRGGLSGAPLDRALTVLVLDVYEEQQLPGVTVLVGDDVATGRIKQTDRSGVAGFSGDLGPHQTVTVAAKCFQPITFFDVDVDHLTVYLDPVVSPDCAEFGELPPGGGTPGRGASVKGEVVWEPDGELRRRAWANVPEPAVETEREVAYVLRLSDRADEPFQLPSPSSAITRDSVGTVGYQFFQWTRPGNFTLYTLAGLEDSSKNPRKFTAYAMGIQRGVAVKPGETTDDVFIEVDVPLDHALTLTLDPPAAGRPGPDRIRASVAIEVVDRGYALLPSGISERPLPGSNQFSFVGVPPLVGTLAGSRYVIGARAVTGTRGAPPRSVIGLFSATSSAEPLDLGGFVPIPKLTSPVANTKWDLRKLTFEPTASEKVVDLTLVKIEAGGDLYYWTLVAPGARGELSLPNLAKLLPDAALPVGTLGISATFAHVDEGFDYGKLRYRELEERGWRAHATDRLYTTH